MNKKKLRLAIDIINQQFKPISDFHRAVLINVITGEIVREKDVAKARSFKPILYRKVIDGNGQLKRVLRYRRKLR